MSVGESITITRVANGFTATLVEQGRGAQTYVFASSAELFMWLEARLTPSAPSAAGGAE